ncbi:hypothetical protein DF186_21480, partial [Enterococcus hirae]
HQQAEIVIYIMIFDYEVFRTVIGLSEVKWVMDVNNIKFKGMLFIHLIREVKTWQMIFVCYVLFIIHFSEISMEMFLFIGCVT